MASRDHVFQRAPSLGMGRGQHGITDGHSGCYNGIIKRVQATEMIVIVIAETKISEWSNRLL